MSHRILDFAEAISEQTSQRALETLLLGALENFAIDRISYGLVPAALNLKPLELIQGGNLDKDWLAHYEANNLQTSDATVLHCLSAHTPLSWSEMFRVNDEGLDPNPLFEANELARDFGINTGVTLPLSSVGLYRAGISVIGADGVDQAEIDRQFTEHEDSIIALCDMFYARLDLRNIGHEFYKLSKRELEILCWIADGKQYTAIASKTRTATSTIEKQAASLRNKLVAGTNAQAVAKAVSLGLL